MAGAFFDRLRAAAGAFSFDKSSSSSPDVPLFWRASAVKVGDRIERALPVKVDSPLDQKMGFSTRAPARIFSLRSFSLSVVFRLLLIFPTLETAYLVPDGLLARQRGVPESSDEEVPAIPYSSDGDGGWSGTAGKSDMDEGAVLTEVAYRLMTRRLSYTPKIPKIKRNPSEMMMTLLSLYKKLSGTLLNPVAEGDGKMVGMEWAGAGVWRGKRPLPSMR